MKKLILFLTIIALSQIVGAQAMNSELEDTCKISVAKVEDKLRITHKSSNVYVRQGDRKDPTNYVFATNKVIEILCNDSTIKLYGGYKKDTVSVWYQKYGENKALQDYQSSHDLSSKLKRRNWLEFKSMNGKTSVSLTVNIDGYPATKAAKINFRKSGEWNVNKVTVNYDISDSHKDSQQTNVEKVFQNLTSGQKNCYEIDAITLGSDAVFSNLRIGKGENYYNMVFNKVLFDGKEIPFTILFKDSTRQELDDIMLLTTITLDSLLNKPLEGGHHNIECLCTVLTKSGPEQVTLLIPIDVEQSKGGLLGIILGSTVGLLILLSLIVLGLKIAKKHKANKRMEKNLETHKGGVDKAPEEKDEDGKNEDEDKQEKSAPEEGGTNTNDKIEFGTDREDPVELMAVQLKGLNDNDLAAFIKKVKDIKGLRKIGINYVIGQWNDAHPENIVDESQQTLASLMDTISKGYIDPKGVVQLLKSLDEYNIKVDEQIGATVINKLCKAVYDRGSIDGATLATQTKQSNGTNAIIEQLKQQNSELSKAKAKLEREKDTLQTDRNAWKEKYDNLEKDQKLVIDEWERLRKDSEGNAAKIAELEQQVSAQGQENVIRLESEVTRLQGALDASNKTIEQKDRDISAEQKKTENVIKKKEEWENKYNKLKVDLDSIADKHAQELEQLKNSHQEASRKQKDKYEELLQTKKTEIENLKNEHTAALDAQKNEYEGTLEAQQSAAEKAKSQLEQSHKAEIKKLDNEHQVEINKLNDTIRKLGVSVNVGRDETINMADQLLGVIQTEMNQADLAVKSIVNQSPIFISVIKNIIADLQKTRDTFNDCREYDWNKAETNQKQVKADMQDLFIEALDRNGWINNVARLLSYSRLPRLHDGTDLPAELEHHGISATLIENIYANMLELLGLANMGIIVPAVLANNFRSDSYDFKNSDTWIDKFFPMVSSRDYKGKVFDIVQVGYTIEGKRTSKPVVQYK